MQRMHSIRVLWAFSAHGLHAGGAITPHPDQQLPALLGTYVRTLQAHRCNTPEVGEVRKMCRARKMGERTSKNTTRGQEKAERRRRREAQKRKKAQGDVTTRNCLTIHVRLEVFALGGVHIHHIDDWLKKRGRTMGFLPPLTV